MKPSDFRKQNSHLPDFALATAYANQPTIDPDGDRAREVLDEWSDQLMSAVDLSRCAPTGVAWIMSLENGTIEIINPKKIYKEPDS